MPVGSSYEDGSLIFVSISAFEVLTHNCNLRFQFPLFKTLVSLHILKGGVDIMHAVFQKLGEQSPFKQNQMSMTGHFAAPKST